MHSKSRGVIRVFDLERADVSIVRYAKGYDRRKRTTHDVEYVLVVSVCDDESVAWYEVYEALKRQLDLVQRVKNIRVIELDIVNNERRRQVMEKFRALIEKGSVVFIAFEHNELAFGARLISLSKIFRNATNEECWLTTVRLERPGHER